MRKLLLSTMVLALMAGTAFGQSDSFNALRDRFKGKEQVESFSIGGFFVNLVIELANDETLNGDAFRNMGGMHLITIPKRHFQSAGLTLDGYRRYIRKEDGYEPLVEIRENGEHVSIYIKPIHDQQNRYLVLIDEADEVTAIEFKGYVDVEALTRKCTTEAEI
jgi:hypothetical protein